MKETHAIECGRCGESRLESLTEEEAKKLRDAIEPIYRQCARCEKTTGWIGSAEAPAGGRELMPQRAQNQSENGGAAADRPSRKGHERMATQAERDNVNSMVHNNAPDVSKD